MTNYRVKEPDFDPQRVSRTRVPHVVPGCDLRNLPLSTLEAYVFSRVDGNMGEDELIVCTGLDAIIVAQALDRLASFGALSFSEPAPRRTVSQTHARAQVSRTAVTEPPKATHTEAPRAVSTAPQGTLRPQRVSGAAPSVSYPSHIPTTSRSAARAPMTSRPAPQTPMTSRPAPSARLSSAAPSQTTTSRPSGPARSMTPVPTTYRPGSVRPENQDQLRRYLEGARVAIDENNPAAAANYYRLAQELAPDDPAIATAVDECSTFSATAKASTDRAMTCVLLGDNAARAKQWSVAAGAYDEAVSLVPKDAVLLYKLAGALYRCGGHLTRATKLVEESISLSRNRVDAWLLLAQIRWEAGARPSAREAAEEARRLRPDDERVGRLLAKLGSVR